MRRYMTVYGVGDEPFERSLKKRLEDDLLYLETEIPETPYAVLDIRVVKRERRYLDGGHDRLWSIGFRPFRLTLCFRSNKRVDAKVDTKKDRRKKR